MSILGREKLSPYQRLLLQGCTQLDHELPQHWNDWCNAHHRLSELPIPLAWDEFLRKSSYPVSVIVPMACVSIMLVGISDSYSVLLALIRSSALTVCSVF